MWIKTKDGRIGLSLWLHYVCITLLALCLLRTLCVMKKIFGGVLIYLRSLPSAFWAVFCSTINHAWTPPLAIHSASWTHGLIAQSVMYIYIYIYIYYICMTFMSFFLFNNSWNLCIGNFLIQFCFLFFLLFHCSFVLVRYSFYTFC